MALFRFKKDTREEVPKPEKLPILKKKEVEKKPTEGDDISRATFGYEKDIASVLLHPRVTEKATVESERGVYVFNISPRAGKRDVREAVKKLYNVSPRRINIVSIPSKKVRVRDGRNVFGKKQGGKKAYVYVKKGDSIDIV